MLSRRLTFSLCITRSGSVLIRTGLFRGESLSRPDTFFIRAPDADCIHAPTNPGSSDIPTMKFEIHTVPTPAGAPAPGWEVSITYPGGTLGQPRRLARCGRQQDAFPLPTDEQASWRGKAHEPLCEPPDGDPSAIRRVYENIVIGDTSEAEIEKFGRYLSAVLLGDNWAEVDRLAGGQGLDIELHISCEDVEMNRLPWEMMYGDSAPLGANRGRDVAITRVIKCNSPGRIKGLSLPLKVLFVIGSPLDDKLRPGAEVYGLLRRVKVPMTGATGNKSVDLSTRLLLEATREDLKQEVARFCPDVVHFICHGVVKNDGGRILMTRPRDENTAGNVRLEPDECNPDQLLEALQGGGAALPQIVILNACHTADATAAAASAGDNINGKYLAMAAQLVAGGVPVAIGMAGEIADAACRIFTHNFYQALIKSESVTLATARGRRAAMYYYKDYYQRSVEWVRPTIFAAVGALDALSSGMAKPAPGPNLTEIPSKFLSDEKPLCDHFVYLKAFEQFRQEVEAGGGRKALAFRLSERESNEEKFGKTRLLEEVAAISVTNNFIPCLIRSDEAFDRPTNLLQFAVMLSKAMDETRERFGVARREESAALAYAFKLFGLVPAITPDMIEFEEAAQEAAARARHLGEQGQPAEPGATLVRRILLADFKQLHADVSAILPASPARKVLLLLDDLHLYEGVAPTLLGETMLGEHGLGDPTLAIPLVFTYSAFPVPEPQALAEIEKFVGRGKYVTKKDLQRFREPYEARLAYSQYILTRKNLTVNWLSTKRQDVEIFYQRLHKNIAGIPKRLYGERVDEAIEFAFDMKTLLDADDEKIMQSLHEFDQQAALPK